MMGKRKPIWARERRQQNERRQADERRQTSEHCQPDARRSKDERAGCDSGPLDVPARISLLYESSDGKLCVFEDAEGHLTAVRASVLV